MSEEFLKIESSTNFPEATSTFNPASEASSTFSIISATTNSLLKSIASVFYSGSNNVIHVNKDMTVNIEEGSSVDFFCDLEYSNEVI